jgi:uncharacterized coiled-coil DUF342 family protein
MTTEESLRKERDELKAKIAPIIAERDRLNALIQPHEVALRGINKTLKGHVSRLAELERLVGK